jgi:CDP-glycerol glycerophosphotransferase (TagB/SpsB family)
MIVLKTRNPVDALAVIPGGNGPLVTCAYHDMLSSYKANPSRPYILMEHGVGLVFGTPGYAGGTGLRTRVSLFLAPNDNIRKKTARAIPGAAQVIIGTPKLDAVISEQLSVASDQLSVISGKRKPVVCISFHWNGSRVAPEAGNAFKHYRDVLPALARSRKFKLIGHGHPKAMSYLQGEYEQAGIEVVTDFREVMRRADVYVNDASSTLYEFCVTGKPVVILNAPWFRRNVKFGIRWWEYTDIGPQVNEPEQLKGTIEHVLANPDEYRTQRERMINDLYPFLGKSARRAAKAIYQFCGERV